MPVNNEICTEKVLENLLLFANPFNIGIHN